MYDPGNLKDITHHVLYDKESKIAVEITAEVNQAPLLSAVRPYEVIDSTNIEKYFASEIKENSSLRVDVQELEDKHGQIKDAMIALKGAKLGLEDRISKVRNVCLKNNLVNKNYIL